MKWSFVKIFNLFVYSSTIQYAETVYLRGKKKCFLIYCVINSDGVF